MAYVIIVCIFYMMANGFPNQFQTPATTEAAVLDSGLYVLGGAGNANASNKPLALCTRWLEDPWIARFGEPFAAQISDDF